MKINSTLVLVFAASILLNIAFCFELKNKDNLLKSLIQDRQEIMSCVDLSPTSIQKTFTKLSCKDSRISCLITSDSMECDIISDQTDKVEHFIFYIK